MVTGMEIVLQVAGVVVPCFAALGGLFAWGVRRMDRRFEEARQDRVRIEAKLSRQITELNREVGKLQGIAGAARFQEVASGSG